MGHTKLPPKDDYDAILAAIEALIDHGSIAGLSDDDHTQYHTDARADTWLATKDTDDLAEGSNLYFTDERAQDAVGSALTDTATVNFTYTDGSNQITADVLKAGVEALLFDHASTVTPSGTTQTIDWDDGNGATIDLGSATGDVTLTLSNPVAGRMYTLIVIQGATARNITWPASVVWPAGVDPILSQDEDAVDKFTFYYDGTNYFGPGQFDFS